MTLKQIAALGKELAAFLALFADCFGRREGRALLGVYVRGLLSNLHRKTAEAIALQFGVAPRTLQRFVESIKWDDERVRDRCQQIVAHDHAHPEAIGYIDESGVGKSGDNTVGVGRQYNGNRGKIDNCVVGVHLGYAAPGFQCLVDSAVYLPEDWASDPVRRKKTMFPRRSNFAPSRKSRWRRSIERWPTESGWRPGRSTSCTVATASFWMAWKLADKCSWPRFPATSTAGRKSQKSCAKPRKTAASAGVAGSTRAWRVGVPPAKSAIC